jgi:putative peptidoglycan lipid II flippase
MRQPLLLGVLAASNIGIAFLYQWYVLVQLGPGLETDALFAGMTVPQLALAVVSGSLMHVLVPLLAGEPADRFRHDAWGFLVLVGALFAAIAVLLYVFAPYWVPLTVPGFSDAGKGLTVHLTRIQLIGMIFSALCGVQAAVYHARQRFLWVELAPLLVGALGLVPLVAFLPEYGVEAAAWIAALRFVFQTLLQMPGMGHWTMPDLKSRTVQEAWKRIKPLLWGTAYYKADPLVDRFLLSMSGNGNLSLFYLAQQIYGAGAGVVSKAIAAPLVPRLSLLHKAGDDLAFRRAYRRKLWQVGLVTGSLLLIVVAFGDSLLRLLVGHGAVTEANVRTLWLIMLGLCGMFVGGAMGSVTTSSFYARGDTRFPTRLGMITYTIYIPIKIMAYSLGGVLALAISVSAFYLVNLLLQYFYLESADRVRGG